METILASALSEQIKNDVGAIINDDGFITYLFQNTVQWADVSSANFMMATGENIAHEVVTLHTEKLRLKAMFDELELILKRNPDCRSVICLGLREQVNRWQNKAIILSMYGIVESHPVFKEVMQAVNTCIDPDFFDPFISKVEALQLDVSYENDPDYKYTLPKQEEDQEKPNYPLLDRYKALYEALDMMEKTPGDSVHTKNVKILERMTYEIIDKLDDETTE